MVLVINRYMYICHFVNEGNCTDCCQVMIINSASLARATKPKTIRAELHWKCTFIQLLVLLFHHQPFQWQVKLENTCQGLQHGTAVYTFSFTLALFQLFFKSFRHWNHCSVGTIQFISMHSTSRSRRFHLFAVHKDYDHKLYLQQNTGVMMIRRKQAVNRKDHAAYTTDKLAEDKLCTANGAHWNTKMLKTTKWSWCHT